MSQHAADVKTGNHSTIVQSHEVGAIWVVNAVAAAHSDYTLAKRSFEDKCVPKLELGNEGARGGGLGRFLVPKLQLGSARLPEALLRAGWV